MEAAFADNASAPVATCCTIQRVAALAVRCVLESRHPAGTLEHVSGNVVLRVRRPDGQVVSVAEPNNESNEPLCSV